VAAGREGAAVHPPAQRAIRAGKEWHDTFPTRALADSFRSDLISVTRRGEAFVVAAGRPVSWQRPEQSVTSWYDHACAYVDMKWPHAAGKSRQGIAESLATVTPALFVDARSRPSAATFRQLLYGWSFNARTRDRTAGGSVRAGSAVGRGQHAAGAGSARPGGAATGAGRSGVADGWQAGGGVDVLLRVYAKCIAGQEDAVRRRVEEALRVGRDQDRSVHGP
jgi:hypothetical protein